MSRPVGIRRLAFGVPGLAVGVLGNGGATCAVSALRRRGGPVGGRGRDLGVIVGGIGVGR